MADAKRRGDPVGRKPRLKPHQVAAAIRLHREEGKWFGSIAALFGVGHALIGH
jgi:hypothetical protein